MTTTTVVATGHINGGPGWPCEIHTEVELIDISTEGPKADRRWSFTDAAGHYHAYSQRGDRHERYPTLRERVEVLPCGIHGPSDECDGVRITHWHCVICGEEVKPGMIPGPHYEWMDGLESWEAKISVPAEGLGELVNAREPISLRVEGGGGEMFGIAQVSGSYSMTSGDAYVTLTLIAASPLGQRKVKP